MTDGLYERDLVLWTEEQAEHLRRAGRAGSNRPLDRDNLAEEIESLGRRDLGEAESRIRRLLVRDAKLACSPARDPRAGRTAEIGRCRFDLMQVLEDSPSPRPRIEGRFDVLVTAATHEARPSLPECGGSVDGEAIAGRPDSVTLHPVLDRGFCPTILSKVEG